jgi:hypothetical protein
MKSLRALVITAALVTAQPSAASVSVAVTFDALVDRAESVMTVVPLDSNSVWEGKRIVTYTRLRVDRSIAGQGASEVVVKTLGGSVGDLGQSVSGEPTFRAGEPSIVFLRVVRPSATETWSVDKAFMVVERAQGQYPLTLDKGTGRMVTKRATDLGALVPMKAEAAAPQPGAQSGAPSGAQPGALPPTRYAGSLAHDVLINRPADDVAQDVIDAWAKRHPAKKN